MLNHNTKMVKKKPETKWKKEQPPYEVGRDGFTYHDIKKENINGWIPINKYRPFPYDLVKLDVGKYIKMGWWTGTGWEGYRLNDTDKVFGWLKKDDDE